MSNKSNTEQSSGEGMSLLAQLRQRREEISQELSQPLNLPVPGYDNLLWVRTKRIEWEQVNKIASRKARKGQDAASLQKEQAADLIIATTECVYFVERGQERVVSERWDDTLAEALGFTAPSARGVVMGVFNNDFAMVQFNNQIYQWLQGEEVEVLTELEGE